MKVILFLFVIPMLMFCAYQYLRCSRSGEANLGWLMALWGWVMYFIAYLEYYNK